MLLIINMQDFTAMKTFKYMSENNYNAVLGTIMIRAEKMTKGGK